MYGFRNFKRDWFWVLSIGLVGTFAFITAMDAIGEINIQRAWRTERLELFGFSALLILVMSFVPLAFRTLMFVEHKGWKRILLIAALITFVVPIFLVSQNRYVTWQEVVFGGSAVGLFFAALAITIPQILFGVFRWVRSGFAESAATQEK